jgi:nucleoside-diphosphate-sugar epimerase
LCDRNTVKHLPDVDLILHLAATNGTKLFYDIPTTVSRNNTLPTFNLIERYSKSKTKFIFFSSCEIFNTTTDKNLYDIPTDEDVPIMFDNIRNPRWSYSIPKALGENVVANCGLEYLIIRYFNVYGPNQKDHFIPEFIDRALNGEYYILGDETRSFCYIDDAIETKISDVAKIILDLMDVDPDKLEVLESPIGSAKRRMPCMKKTLEHIDYRFQYDIRKGLKCILKNL